ncbi:uncharacterized protein PV06_10894 [Exophiala oligosperma]|uniref:Uncharacterized protein n=1 Tax=Exophiala oligosperma TaxID=215243 RepID=A0A0D2A9J8_9EURO|nr:uncharacterized protein PV06_10894 [Exophiala oligosperma]KIW36996.1 hypothetical protein PV06_10894 [Exophiala oligosperma]
MQFWQTLLGGHYRQSPPPVEHAFAQRIGSVSSGWEYSRQSDVPELLQEKIRLEDEQRRNRKRKATAASSQGYPPVNITNVIPNHAEPPLPQSSQTKSQLSIFCPIAVSALDIPGYRDDAVWDYVEYLQGKVRNHRHREEFQKAGSIELDELLES